MALNIYEELDLTSSGDNVDEGFLKCKNNWSTTDTELHNARDGETNLITKLDTLSPLTGHIRRSKFTFNNTTTIKVGGGAYDVNGTLAKITSELTTTAHGITGADWAYLYIDYSSIPSDGVLLQSDIIWAITEPAWSDSLLGWYNGSDRCIFACRIAVTSDAILEFEHSVDSVIFGEYISVLSGAAVSDTFTDITAFTMPIFSIKANVTIKWTYTDQYTSLLWRTNGSAVTNGHWVATPSVGNISPTVTIDVITDSSFIIEMKESVASTNQCTITQNGWYLPEGM